MPVRQREHLVDELVGANWPGGHGVHVLDSFFPEKEPGVQGAQDDEPWKLAMDPAGHTSHIVDAFPGANLPSSQGRQTLDSLVGA